MKIHRIETVNLNSLYDTQVVDLDVTLGGASLFLIYGPTGSGKSTLMDAVSLALFGVTPRLDAAKGNESRDPRAIMSRGTGECSAEVVFSKIEGGGRQTYRARWSCRRAHKKPEGAWQGAVRSLDRLAIDGSSELMVSSHKKKDFAPVFDEVLEGFGVRDFNRSMLLAQGQFDAFLGAPPGERAEILERLTDTSIYQRIGERAAQIRGRHERRLEALRTLAAARGGLDEATLAELEEVHKGNTGALTEHKRARERADQRLKWFDADIELRGKLAEAEKSQRVLVEAKDKAAGALARLAEHERCENQKAFGLLDAHGLAQEQVTRRKKQLEELDDSLPALEFAAKGKKSKAGAATASKRLAAKHLEDLRPLAAAAEKATSEHTRAAKLAEKTAAERKEADARVGPAREELTRATGALAEAKGKADEAQADLEAHASDGELASGWDPIRTRLDQLVSTSEGLSKNAEALGKHETDLELGQVAFTNEQETYEAGREIALEPARESFEQAERVLEGLLSKPDFEASHKEVADLLERARSERDAIKDAVEPAATARNAAAKLDRARKQVEVRAGELAVATDALAGLSRDVEAKAELESHANDALERTRRVAGLVEHRAALVEGEPCPLCGSEEHPWSHDAERKAADVTISEPVAAAEREHDKAREAHKAAKLAHREAEVIEKGFFAQLELLKHQNTSSTQEQTELDRTAAAALEPIRLPLDSSIAEVDEALQQATRRLDQADKALSELDAAQNDVSKAERQRREAVEGQRNVESGLRDRQTKLKEQGERLDTDRTEHAQAMRASSVERDVCRTLLEQLGLTLDGDDPARWRDLGDLRRREHELRVKAVTDLKAHIENADTVRKGKEELLGELESQRDKLVESLGNAEADRDAKRGLAEGARELLDLAWQVTLTADDARPADGLPPVDSLPAALLDAQKARVEETEEAAEAAASDESKAGRILEAARTERRTLAQGQAHLVAAGDRARSELDAVLVALTVAGDDELRKLRLPDDLVVELRDKKKDLDDRKLRVETLIRERQKNMEENASTRPEALADDAEREPLVADVTAATTRHGDAVIAHEKTGDQLRDHYRAVQAQEENQRVLREAEQVARVWQTLHQYIGVNDGGKFKEFAQALNLRQLLDKANVHLARLSRRYRLVPRLVDGLPTLEFDLSDLWQIGERVAPRSLSGGERFLVSLSLALGLSDFRAIKMPIETLLLDEGFGTLDPDTLSVALGALSQLQADGRQVGIISHVVGLQERIEARIEVRPLGGGRSEVRPTG